MCPLNGKMVSSSSLVLMSSKTILMKTHNCATSTTSVNISIVGELQFFNGLHNLFFIFKVVKKAIRCLEKGFPHNFAVFEWLLVFSKNVTDAIGSNSCGLTLGLRFGVNCLPCSVLQGGKCSIIVPET